jgi:hypothetical protein
MTFKKFKNKKSHIGKISMHFILKFFIYWWLIFNFILTLLWHNFLIHIFHFICVTTAMSLFKNFIMSSFFSYNSSIFKKYGVHENFLQHG